MRTWKKRWVVCLPACLWLWAAIGIAADMKAAPAAPRSVVDRPLPGTSDDAQYCVQTIPDVNGDGKPDRAVSKKNAVREYPLVAYIVLDETIPLSGIGPADIAAETGVILLTGPAAAPFLCRPAGPAAAAMARLQAMRAAPAAQSASPIGRPTHYKLVQLPIDADFPGDYPLFNGINESGHAVGQHNGTAVYYDNAAVYDLGTLGGHSSEAFHLNRYDDVVGVSLTGESDEYGFVSSPFIYDGLAMESLGIRYAAANKINDVDQIVGGMIFTADDRRPYRGFLYEAGQVTELGTLGGPNSEAHSINTAGQVVGRADAFIDGTDIPSTRAFVYQNGTINDLGALGHLCYPSDDEGAVSCYEVSVATDINEQGQIVGYSSTDSGRTHAFFINGGRMVDLGTLGGFQSWAHGLNEEGQIVGTSLTAGDAAYAPFLYERGAMVNLLDRIIDLPQDAAVPFGALDINNFGRIVGSYMILEPQYEQIDPDGEYTFEATLDGELTFAYWIAADAGRPRAWVRPQVKIELPEEADNPRRLRRLLDRWRPADRYVPARSWGESWREAAVALPQQVRGQTAIIHIRARKIGSAASPVIYMRHFSMSE